jgi:DNA helicase-2/ATP-dependent DNA helicase PcrA
MTLTLTDQQLAVVHHPLGPALVFAVAGAGKTTAMVHRIERLARESVFASDRILATSFGTANVDDLKRALRAWPHCRRVDVRTLHSLGYDLVRRAIDRNYLRLKPEVIDAERVLNAMLVEARRQSAPFVPELDGFDRRDFLDYVGGCKGTLACADLAQVALPASAQSVATQAEAPEGELNWYLDGYRLYEHVRLQHGWLTFDDMLLTGWSVLVTRADILAEAQARYACVLVDEFQDVNLAQSEILDLITRPHRNYMAIGDDDQTIYEWRNASPQFILDFPQRYQARTYLISDNFRCPAAPLMLANAVIAHNRQRQLKHLSLTRGFEGEATVVMHESAAEQARYIVDRIVAQHHAGAALNDFAVLVRLNSQTPYLEQQLITRGLPYRISQPFYARAEIVTLINYCRLAWCERCIRSGELLTTSQWQQFNDAWVDVCNRPKHYLTRELLAQLARAVPALQQPLSRVLEQASFSVERDNLVDDLQELADLIEWLSTQLDQPAQTVLRELDERLNYQEFLRDNSGFAQTGEGRALSVAAFIEYARERGSVLEFLQHVRQLAQQKIGHAASDGQDAVTLSTIHQAKGLEWSNVFVPDCNQGTLPFTSEHDSNLEEERRLFYVAVTRTRHQLTICAIKAEEPSQFLDEAAYASTLTAARMLQQMLAREPRTWQAHEAAAFMQYVADHHLERYFQKWWTASRERQQAVAYTLQRLYAAAADQGALPRLKLPAHQLAVWRAIAPLPATEAPTDFPGLAR